jgi:hypothetical protein
MSDDNFFERLRTDAGALRHQPDENTLARIRTRIREQVERPTVMQILATWFRPLAATLTAIAIAAAIGVAALDGGALNGSTETTLGQETVEISMAGDTYRVGD